MHAYKHMTIHENVKQRKFNKQEKNGRIEKKYLCSFLKHIHNTQIYKISLEVNVHMLLFCEPDFSNTIAYILISTQ